MLPSEEADKISALLLKIEDDQGRDVRYVLDATGRMHEAIANITYQNQSPVSYMRTEYTYDGTPSGYYSRGLESKIRNTWNVLDPMTSQWQETVLVQNEYTYSDNASRLSNTISDSSGPIRTEECGYDALGRLTSVDYGDGQTQTYTFDAMGNRTQKADSISGTENYTYNAANMLLTRGANSYTNDANGNTLTGGGRTNTWDGQNRLIECVVGGDDSAFVYGADGLRRQATVNATTTDFILDGPNLVREKQGSNATATYLIGPRGPEYRRSDSTSAVRWYLYDGLGSVLGEVDGGGNITASRKYDVYGGVRDSGGTSTSNQKFAGDQGHSSEQETGLIYLRARYMDPETGRFESQDSEGDGANWFAYCKNDPVNLTDPDGHKSTLLQRLLANITNVGAYNFACIASLTALVCSFPSFPPELKIGAIIPNIMIAAYAWTVALGGNLEMGLVVVTSTALTMLVGYTMMQGEATERLGELSGGAGFAAGAAVGTYGIALIVALALTEVGI